jgi:hypothetical protein
MSYSHIDHSHCWGSDNPPCGQKVEHLVCCLCGLPHPSIKASIEAAKEEEGREIFEELRELAAPWTEEEGPRTWYNRLYVETIEKYINNRYKKPYNED